MRNFAIIWSRIKFSIISIVCLQRVIGEGTRLSLGFYYAHNVVTSMTSLPYICKHTHSHTHTHTHTHTEAWLHYTLPCTNFWDLKKSSWGTQIESSIFTTQSYYSTPANPEAWPSVTTLPPQQNKVTLLRFTVPNWSIGSPSKNNATPCMLRTVQPSVYMYIYIHVACMQWLDRERSWVYVYVVSLPRTALWDALNW
jgi:hypothetical protein